MKEKLRQVMNLGVSQSAIARGAGIAVSTLSNYMNGARNLSEEKEQRLEEWLKTFKEEIAKI